MTTIEILEALIKTLSDFATPEITETVSATCAFETTKKEVWFRTRNFRFYGPMQDKMFHTARLMATIGADYIITFSGNYGYNHISFYYSEISENNFNKPDIQRKIEIHIDNIDN